MTEADPFRLDRFVRAQDTAGTFSAALAELGRGRKTTHWMWFVFPQLAGLGSSPTARFYAIGSAAEAAAYLAHPRLGPRMQQAADAVLGSPAPSAEALLGTIDAVKLRSSVTLFGSVAPSDGRFAAVLARYFAGPDPSTVRLLGDAQGRAEPRA